MNDMTDALWNAYNAFFTQFASFLPKLLGAIIILIVGWILAKIVKAVSIRVMKLIRLNVVTDKSGVEKFLQDGGVQKTALEIVGALFYWLIMLIVILAAFNSVGLTAASQLFNQIVLFIPNIIVAVLVLVFGLFLANFTSQVFTSYLKNIGIGNAETIGKIAQIMIVVFVVSLTLTQLSIGKELVTSVFLIAFGSVSLALAIAFGLGGKEWAAGILKRFEGKTGGTE